MKPNILSKNKKNLYSRLRRKSSFTLVELVIALGILAGVAALVYIPYRTTLHSVASSNARSTLQQNARIAMERMVALLEAGMSVDMKNEEDIDNTPFPDDGDGIDWLPENGDNGNDDGAEKEDRYNKKLPYFMIFYLPDPTNPSQPKKEVAIYAALPDDKDTPEKESIQPLDPATTESGRPALWMRGYKYNEETDTWGWEEPVPLISSAVKVTQLNFILEGEKEGRVIITLELAVEIVKRVLLWQPYKLTSAVKIGVK